MNVLKVCLENILNLQSETVKEEKAVRRTTHFQDYLQILFSRFSNSYGNIILPIYIQIRKFPLFAIFSVFSLPNENRIILLWTHFTKKKSVINVWMGLGFNRTRKMRKQKNSLLGNKTENQELKHSCDLFGTKSKKKWKGNLNIVRNSLFMRTYNVWYFSYFISFFCCLSYVMCGKLLFGRHKAQIAKTTVSKVGFTKWGNWISEILQFSIQTWEVFWCVNFY